MVYEKLLMLTSFRYRFKKHALTVSTIKFYINEGRLFNFFFFFSNVIEIRFNVILFKIVFNASTKNISKTLFYIFVLKDLIPVFDLYLCFLIR